MKLLTLGCLLLSLLALALAKFEPYRVLGVNRRASQSEIKKAYKGLARVHHPDKNKGSKESQDKFLEINKAYELLSDPDRRRDYDNHGITEDTPNFRNRHDYTQYGRFEHDNFFDSMFGGQSGFRFQFGGGGRGGGESRESLFHKQVITAKAYWNNILPNSSKQPYLIMFFTNWCMTCVRIEPIWARLVEELEPVGFHFSSVLASVEKELTRKVGASELPHMVLLLDGKVIHYKDPQFSALKVLEFIRRKFPYKMVEVLDDSNVDSFLNGWSDNRVRVLLFGHTDVIRLRYLTTAFRYRTRAAIGYIKVTDAKAAKIVRRFGVTKLDKVETMLVFQEDPTRPVASVTMKDLSLNTMFEVLDTHQYLQLPRLSSQEIFDSLCPPESVRTRKRLCVTLIADKSALSDTPTFNADGSPAPLSESAALKCLRDFGSEFKHERVKFTYIWRDKQADFVKSLVSGSSEADLGVSDPQDRVAILWRRENNKIKFEWLKQKWDFDDQEDYLTSERANNSREELSKVLKRLLAPNEVLPHETEIRDLFDEHAQSLFVRIANRMLEMLETIRESVTKDEVLPAVSLVVTVGLLIAGGYVMNYLVKMEEESVQRTLGAKGMKVDKKGKVVPELKIHELRAETYNGMVRLLKPGCRTLVLIVDKESKDKLVPKFYKMAWPYRRNKTLMFGFIFIEKGLPWFKKILNLTLPEPREININPKNCIGTVLSLNGHRRYFCMFHAKHPEGSRKRIYTANNGSVAGAFMGFDSEFEEDSEGETSLDVEGQNQPIEDGASSGGLRNRNPQAVPLLDSPDHLPIFEDQLLDGLQLWMDRLFEGSTYRYHINYWPEFPISPSAFARN